MPPDRRVHRSRRSLRVPEALPATLALLPLRAFLGITFVYGGVQKLSDPGFLHPGAASYIGTLLRQYANGTPGGWVLRTFAIPHAGVSGVGVAIVEITVGLLVLGGLLTRLAALVGLLLNLLLFLTASWKTHPYFLGSDIVFVFAWVPFVLAGAAGQPALDNWLAERERAARVRARPGREPAMTRRGLLGRALAATGVGALAIAGLSALAKGRYTGGAGPRQLGAGEAAPKPRPGAHQGSGAGATGAPAGLPSGAVRIGSASQVPAGQAALYRDPADGNPDIVYHPGGSTFIAHSAICTHAGCTVGFQGGKYLCPCHGSIFDPRTGAVDQGPATTPLPARRVIEHGGELYAVPS